ncbi:short-chain fatty acyl-CoA regulator family protein [Mycobacterium talmoniae]|uniref:HTH-type transcriptional regulator PrpR n=1 Tax=Mycobacterium talmoniae TaxID=1858794 RepID=A0A2S8BSF6_9MYCO|nr:MULTISPECIES: short-chain fatty acyl-CoA regulator family protein [Mycobacterium]PQM49563.1 HTH-type transcriptional regulator PrpR [Mycobacterium talmoniae]TDH53133.1 ImmA/IrrE family metallo-endopeptidase [Mycobacterium eburneum]
MGWGTLSAVAKMFSGARLRRLREERGLTQAALARALDLSTSYVNQLENDQRPITVAVLLALTERFDLPTQYFSPDSDARLVADLRDLFTATAGEHAASDTQIEELVARMPEIGRSLVTMHRRLRDATEELEGYRSHAITETPLPADRPMPFEEVRDFFYDRNNYIGELDMAAEQMFADSGMRIGGLDLQLAELMRTRFGITVVIDNALAEGAKRAFDPDTGVLRVAHWLLPGQRAFQLATQLALLTQSELMSDIVAGDDQLSPESRGVARIGLANYFAGAFLLPYRQFHAAATDLRYDIDLLARRFEVGFETVCHRLSTLQRPRRRGVPFIFVRIDKAGNISKRQSATAFHFSRVGGSCPLWVVHDAFAQPGRIVTQVAQMPDGRSYFWIATTTPPEGRGYLGQHKSFAIGLGCDLVHADKLVYSTGVALDDPTTAVPIGAGCKICTREACPQRAFPYLGGRVVIDENTSSGLPYSPRRY